jgi:hypothetical protein
MLFRSNTLLSLSRVVAHNVVTKSPGKNWPKAFERHNPKLKSRKQRAVDWNRHDNNIYDKMVHWFEVIGKVLQDPDIQSENVST